METRLGLRRGRRQSKPAEAAARQRADADGAVRGGDAVERRVPEEVSTDREAAPGPPPLGLCQGRGAGAAEDIPILRGRLAHAYGFGAHVARVCASGPQCCCWGKFPASLGRSASLVRSAAGVSSRRPSRRCDGWISLVRVEDLTSCLESIGDDPEVEVIPTSLAKMRLRKDFDATRSGGAISELPRVPRCAVVSPGEDCRGGASRRWGAHRGSAIAFGTHDEGEV